MANHWQHPRRLSTNHRNPGELQLLQLSLVTRCIFDLAEQRGEMEIFPPVTLPAAVR